MKKIWFLVFMIIPAEFIYSQDIMVEINAGLGNYNHKDIKSFQNYLLSFAPSQTKEVASFPPYFYYSASFENRVNKRNLIGMSITMLSSGAKNDIKDYSGEYSLDLHLNGIGTGFQYRHIFFSFNKVNIYAKVRAGLIFSTFYLNENLHLTQTDTVTTSKHFHTENIYIEPSAGVMWNFWNKLSLDFSMGYEFDTNGSLLWEDSRQSISLPSGKPLTTDWSGFRILAGISYRLH